MAVEVVESPKTAVAEHTLVRRTVPGPLRGDTLNVVVTIGQQSPRNGDYVIAVVDPDPSVDHSAIGTGWTRPSLEMEYHCRLADKGLRTTTVLECTWYILWTMHAGVEVLMKTFIRCRHELRCTHRTQVAFGPEDTVTLGAVEMRLSVMLSQASGGLEELIAHLTVEVIIDAV